MGAVTIASYFHTIVFGAFILWVLRNVLFWVGLWQDKEYRLDRLVVHLTETVQGRHVFTSWGNRLKWLFFLGYIFVAFYDTYATWYELLLGLFFILQALFIIKDGWYHRIKRPVFTSKALVLIVLSLLFISVFLIYPLMNTFFWLLFVDRTLPFVVALFVFFMAFPTEVAEDIKIGNAKKKMQRLEKILVIAVSGSYGKTSTKEYIAQVLSHKYKVVKTPGSNNTPVGIANTILHKIHNDTEVFVVEMGAYKLGEIAELTQIVAPSISVTTAISDQHISLYGSLQNVINSEYELIHALPKNGLALFNGNSKNIEKLFDRAKIEKVWYQVFTRKPKDNPRIGAYHVQASIRGVTFTALLHGKEFLCKTPLFGVHVVENILPALFLADRLGFSKKEMSKAIAELQPPAQTMIKRELRNGAFAMDDTFNASPESVFSAMDFLKLSPKKKIFVLAPLTELGSEAKKRHFQVGEKASGICDFLFLLNSNFSSEISKGVIEGKGTCHVQIARPEEIAKIIAKLTKKGDMIIFEGKESKMVMNKLL